VNLPTWEIEKSYEFGTLKKLLIGKIKFSAIKAHQGRKNS